MRGWYALIIGTFAALAALILGGSEPFGRLAARAGLPDLALKLLDDPAQRGLALYRSGAFAEAAEAFAESDPSMTYNRANAHAKAGDYAEALLAYDAVLVRDPDHADARANFELIASLYSGTRLELNGPLFLTRTREGETMAGSEAQGGARASGQGSEAGAGTDFFKPDLKTGLEQRGVRQPFDDLFILANDRWLVTLEDQPGKYLAARLKAEQKRRIEDGTAVPPGDDPW